MSRSHTGKKLSLEHRKRIGKAVVGKKNGNFGKVMPVEQKRQISNSVKRYNLEHGVMFGRISGTNESKLLNKQEKIDNCKIDREFTILSYKPDGYCHETNTIYEVYENFHNKQIFMDLERETKICNYLSCDFIIIYDTSH